MSDVIDFKSARVKTKPEVRTPPEQASLDEERLDDGLVISLVALALLTASLPILLGI